MEDNVIATWTKDVHDVLTRYHKPAELARHPASEWPMVRDLQTHTINTVSAIRKVIDQALTAMAAEHEDDAYLLRQHYIRQRSIELLQTELSYNRATLYRRRARATQALAVILADLNQQTQRQRRAAQFWPRTPIIGFESLAASLSAKIVDEHEPVVLVVEGMGGLGKTTLARLIAHQCAQHAAFVDVLWTSAKRVDFDYEAGTRRVVRSAPINADDLIRTLAGELHLDTRGNIAALRDDVRAHCKQKPYLIIFDNLESVADMAALAPVIDMLAIPSRILITTRDHALDALPATLDRSYSVLAELDAPLGYQLLRAAATYTGAKALARASEAELARIYAVTGGNPLALWLVAGQARDMPWQTFLDDLVAQRPQDHTGYELYEYLYRRSWEQLSANARTVLLAMHRCELGATYDLLLDLSGLEQGAFRRAVSELRRRMLLQVDERYLYSIHRLTYSFLRTGIVGWWDHD